MRLAERAFRQDWPIPPETQAKILKRIARYLDEEDEEGATARDRIVLGAARVMLMAGKLGLAQQALDLARRRIEGKKADFSPADLVQAAEERARKRIAERETEDDIDRDQRGHAHDRRIDRQPGQ